MPNGGDKNLTRLIITIAGFRARYDSWPTVIRLPDVYGTDAAGRMSHYLEFSAAEHGAR